MLFNTIFHLAMLPVIGYVSHFIVGVCLESPFIDNSYQNVVNFIYGSSHLDSLQAITRKTDFLIKKLFYNTNMHNGRLIFTLKDKKIITFFLHSNFLLLTLFSAILLLNIAEILQTRVLIRRIRRILPTTIFYHLTCFIVLISSYILKVSNDLLLRYSCLSNFFIFIRFYSTLLAFRSGPKNTVFSLFNIFMINNFVLTLLCDTILLYSSFMMVVKSFLPLHFSALDEIREMFANYIGK